MTGMKRTAVPFLIALFWVVLPAASNVCGEEAVEIEASRLYHEGRADAARALLEGHLSENPGDVDAHIAYCELRCLMGEKEMVRSEYRKLHEKDPANRAVELSSIKLLRRSGEKNSRFQDFLERNPDYARGWEEYGKGALDGLDEGDAIEALERAASLDPQRAQTYLYLGIAHRLAEEPAEELAALRNAARLDPESAHIRLELAKTIFYAGDPEEAEEYLAGLEGDLRGNAEYYAIRARVLLDLGRADEAMEMRELAVKTEPALSENLAFWATRLRLSGQNVEAEREFNLAIFLDSSYVEAYMQLAVHQRALRRYDDAIQTYYAALRHGPRQGEPNLLAWRNLSALHEIKGDLEKAEEYARKTLEINPDYLSGWVGLSRVLTSLERTEEAIKAWKRVIRMAPYGREAREARRNLHYLEKGERVPSIEEELERGQQGVLDRPGREGKAEE